MAWLQAVGYPMTGGAGDIVTNTLVKRELGFPDDIPTGRGVLFD